MTQEIGSRCEKAWHQKPAGLESEQKTGCLRLPREVSSVEHEKQCSRHSSHFTEKALPSEHSIAYFALIFVKLVLTARRSLDLVIAQVRVQAVPSLGGRQQTWSSAGTCWVTRWNAGPHLHICLFYARHFQFLTVSLHIGVSFLYEAGETQGKGQVENGFQQFRKKQKHPYGKEKKIFLRLMHSLDVMKRKLQIMLMKG